MHPWPRQRASVMSTSEESTYPALETEGLRRKQRRVIYGVLTLLDPSLTLTRMQNPAMVGNTGNRKPPVYAGFAIPCNVQKRLTAHS